MNDRKRERPADYFKDWKEREALAEGMIPMVGRLSREKKCQVLHLWQARWSIAQCSRS